MSISALSGSTASLSLAEMMQQARQSAPPDPDEMAEFIVEKDDQDGDGLLSLEETPLDEDRFNEIDTDGDGYITAEELSTDAQSRMADGSAPPPPPSMSGVSGAEDTQSAESDSEEEYDEYDLNEDGVVSMDELLQAFRGGDLSLSSLLGSLDQSSMTQRLGIQAYEAQLAAV